MTGGAHKSAGNWADLRVRILSGVILAAAGVLLLSSYGVLLAFGVSILTGLLMWELARMTARAPATSHAVLTGGVSAVVMLISLLLGGRAVPMILLPVLIGWIGTARAHRPAFAAFALGIFGAGYGLVLFREGYGLLTTFWIAGTVVVSDIMGYFAGRAFGGPKFWPAISPKKTWSGTVAGWIGAAIFALLLVLATGWDNWQMLLIGPVIAFAGQMGDIAESWLKRRVGVKDSSRLIPGHGGVMDRFDALSGAFLIGLALSLLRHLVGG